MLNCDVYFFLFWQTMVLIEWLYAMLDYDDSLDFAAKSEIVKVGVETRGFYKTRGDKK